MNTMNLKVEYSRSAKIITWITLAVIAAGEYYLITSWIHASNNWTTSIVACLLLLIVIYFALESPSSIEMNIHELILHKRKGKLRIAYDQITDASNYKPDKSEIRYFGSGGVFGFIGKFSNATIGTYQSYVGNYEQAFLIRTKTNKKYVLSCENRELVINTLKTHQKL
jgi:hypothetical protein